MSETLQMEATATDFDFLLGSWNVANRMLRRRLAGSDDWEEFAATAVVRPILDGLGNEDVFRTEHDGGFVGMSFRFFDPEKRRWSIYWADSRRPGELDPPVVGCFEGDLGVFHGEDVHRGRPILVRFTWSRVTTETPAVGAGVLRRRRQDLGDELGDGLRTGRGRERMTVLDEPVAATVPAADLHVAKHATPGRSVSLGDAVLKWYDIARREAPIPDEVGDLARLGLAEAARLGELRLGDALGFVILHRCGEDFYFLIVSSVAERERALADRLGEGRRRRSGLPPVAARGRAAPSDLLRLGARRRGPRARRVEPLPPLRARIATRGSTTSATCARGSSCSRHAGRALARAGASRC